METFDFDGTAPQTATFDTGFTLSVTGTVQDANPAPGVTFTLSASGTFATEVPNGNGLAAILDFSGPGFRVVLLSQASTIVSNNGMPSLSFTTIPPTEAFLTFGLNTTTPNRTAFDTGSVPVISVNGTAVNGTVAPDGSAIRFTISNPATSSNISQLTAGFTCFCAGTRIATSDGAKAVEDLEPGDRLRLADGAETTVKWLGRQSVSKTFADPRRVNPICIKAGALGNEHDLYVSPDHGIALEGYLVNASALVNGETIYQVAEMPSDWTYYHVETEAHELILAEGIPTESYVDLPSRAVFDNGDERADAPRIEPMSLPRISSRRMLPPGLNNRTRQRAA